MSKQGPLTNQKLGNKYLLGELLGHGGFGAVYKAQHLQLNRPQAIKVLHENLFLDPHFRDRFLREAQLLAALNHPYILPVYDFEIEQNRAYLVMPLVSGGTFQDVLKRYGPLQSQTIASCLGQICSAIDYAHARNIIHLDLKPLNLLVQDNILLLSDFGLAHLVQQGDVQGGTSLGFGSPHYMAPEHVQGKPELRSDIYALGVMLYQILTGNLPFTGSIPELIHKIFHESPPPLRSIRPELPVTLEIIITKALAKKPEDRYLSAGELLRDFQATLSAVKSAEPQPQPFPSILSAQDAAIVPPSIQPSVIAPVVQEVYIPPQQPAYSSKQGNYVYTPPSLPNSSIPPQSSAMLSPQRVRQPAPKQQPITPRPPRHISRQRPAVNQPAPKSQAAVNQPIPKPQPVAKQPKIRQRLNWSGAFLTAIIITAILTAGTSRYSNTSATGYVDLAVFIMAFIMCLWIFPRH